MAVQVALNLKGLSPALVLQRSEEFKTGVNSNPSVFTTPDPTVVALTALITDARTKTTAADAAVKTAHDAIVARDLSLAALVQADNSLGAYVQKIANASANPAATVALANMNTKATPTKYGQLGQVQHLAVSIGDVAGSLDLVWDPMAGRSNYEIQMCTGDPTVDANWKFLKSCTSSRKTLRGLTSGTQVWLRVRAVAPDDANSGDWSSPVAKFVP